MKFGWKIVWFAGCLMGGAQVTATPMVQIPALEYSQDGINFQSFSAISAKAKATTYYDYRNSSGHPGFGTARGLTSAAVYWDSRHDLLSLILVAGTAGRGKGEIKFTMDGLPQSSALGLSDDPDEFKYSHGKSHATARFRYKNGTDGLVLGGLEASDSVAISVAVNPVKRVGEWRLVDGDPNDGGSYIDLDLSKPLYLRTVEISSTPSGHHHHHTPAVPPVLPPDSGDSGTPASPDVPEPASGAMILAALGLLTVRRRR